MVNTYDHSLAMNTENTKIVDDEGKCLVCAVTKLAANDLRRAIRRDILIGSFNAQKTTNKIELLAGSERIQLKNLNDGIKDIRKTMKYSKKHVVAVEMQTKPIVTYFAIMNGKNKNISDYIFRKILEEELEGVVISSDRISEETNKYEKINFADDYKEKILKYYEKEVKING